jgi:hypothetical protein
MLKERTVVIIGCEIFFLYFFNLPFNNKLFFAFFLWLVVRKWNATSVAKIKSTFASFRKSDFKKRANSIQIIKFQTDKKCHIKWVFPDLIYLPFSTIS